MAEPTQKKTIIFTIGRMNPPTGGHMKLIESMMIANSELPKDDLGRGIVYIILSHTQNNTKDPLSCSEKRNILANQGMINNIKKLNSSIRFVDVEILCPDYIDNEACSGIKSWLLKPICNIIEREKIKGGQPTNMVLFIGLDRAERYEKLLKTYVLNIPFEFVTLPRIIIDDALMDQYIKGEKTHMPVEHMSASYMKNLVKYRNINNNKDRFIALYQDLGLSESDAQQLFEDVSDAFESGKMSTPKSNPKTVSHTTVMKSKSKSKTPTLKKGGNKCTEKNKRSKNKRSKNKRSKNKRNTRK